MELIRVHKFLYINIKKYIQLNFNDIKHHYFNKLLLTLFYHFKAYVHFNGIIYL